ncbi:FTR1 family iron permease [Rhizobium sp. BR 362]|uniref:FTR1 family iron permease n=1 Tax=Rhizobium sp. BR 362 TaxID=3040670 RepID=UPI002F400629
MSAALIIVFREIIEAGLVIGIVAAVTRGVAGRALWIMAGVLAGVLGSCIVALFTGTIAAAFAGSGQELLNAGILVLAVLMLAWHNIWMAQHGRELVDQLKSVGKSVATGSKSLAALAVVVGVAVLREGAEVVLFLYGIFVSGNEAPVSLAIGSVLGLCLGAALSYLTFRGLVRIPPKHIFRVTGIMVTLLAAGMAAQAVGFLESANLVTWLDGTVWDTSGALAEASIVGRILHTLIGYMEQPTLLQVITYFATVVIITGLSRRIQEIKAPVPSA